MVSRVLAAVNALRRAFTAVENMALGRVPATVTKTVLDFVQQRFSDDIRTNFGEARTPDLTLWPKLKWRRGMPLILTRTLMRAAIDSVKKATYDGKRIAYGMGAGAPKYWAAQNFGWGRIPARTYYGVRKTTLEELAERATEAVAIDVVHAAKNQQQA